MSLHAPWQAMCHYYKPHRHFFLIQIFFAGPLLMTELQNGAIGYPSTAWQMVWERSKTMRLICMKRRVTDLFTDFVFPAMHREKKAEVSPTAPLAVGAFWAWDGCILQLYLQISWFCCHASSSPRFGKIGSSFIWEVSDRYFEKKKKKETRMYVKN